MSALPAPAHSSAAGHPEYAQQDVLGAHISVAEGARVLRGVLQRAAPVGREALLGTSGRAGAADRNHRAGQTGHVQPQRGEHPRSQTLRLRGDTEQQMLRADVAVPEGCGRVPGGFYSR